MKTKSIIIGLLIAVLSAPVVARNSSYSWDADIGYVFSDSDNLFYKNDIIFNSLIKAKYDRLSFTGAIETIDGSVILNTVEVDYNLHDKFYVYGGKIGNTFGLQPVYLSGSIPSANRAITNPAIFRNIRSSITISEFGLGFKYIDSNVTVGISYFAPENIKYDQIDDVDNLLGDGGSNVIIEENTQKIQSKVLDSLVDIIFVEESPQTLLAVGLGEAIEPIVKPIIDPVLSSLGIDIVDLLTTSKITTIENREDAVSVNFSYTGSDYNFIMDRVITQSKISTKEEDKEAVIEQLFTAYTVIGIEKFLKTGTSIGAEVMYINPENYRNSSGYNLSVVQEINNLYMVFANYANISNSVVGIEETNIGVIRNFSDIGFGGLSARVAHHEQFNIKSNTLTVGYSF